MNSIDVLPVDADDGMIALPSTISLDFVVNDDGGDVSIGVVAAKVPMVLTLGASCPMYGNINETYAIVKKDN